MEPATLVLAALGCALVLEGLPYFVAPSGSRRAMQMLADQEDGRLRAVGFTLMVVGLLMVWVAVRIVS